jgi:hypothetical protein
VQSLVLDGLTSPHTRRAYEQALEEFLIWLGEDISRSFTKAAVPRHAADARTNNSEVSMGKDTKFKPRPIRQSINAIPCSLPVVYSRAQTRTSTQNTPLPTPPHGQARS